MERDEQRTRRVWAERERAERETALREAEYAAEAAREAEEDAMAAEVGAPLQLKTSVKHAECGTRHADPAVLV